MHDFASGCRPREVSAKYNCPYATVWRWQRKQEKTPGWSPQAAKATAWNRIFTDEEEKAIATMIYSDFISKGMLFTDHDFRDLILDQYVQKYGHAADSYIPDFNCSNGYIYKFKAKYKFSSRKAHVKRRGDVSKGEIEVWRRQMQWLLENGDRDCILNCDETSWKLHSGNILTWARCGSENVRIDIRGDEKECITVLATITANGGKLPLYFLASGKTARAEESQLGDIFCHWSNHSDNGWETSETFQTYLMHLREHFGDRELHLILDKHTSHRTADVSTLAESLRINLWFIPSGCTDLLQPLDRKCFGALKSTARRLLRERVSGEQGVQLTKKDAVASMIWAWEHLGEEVIDEAWEIST